MKVFHIDNGRKYFLLQDLKEIADTMADAGYDYIELAIGNDGMRFLLDDMKIETESNIYYGDKVREAINFGNKKFCDCGINELTESEMDEFIAYCKDRNIGIIPLLNTPGHMDAIVDAMEKLGIENVRYQNSVTTIDLGNNEAVSFTRAIINKYAEWFAKKGCEFFNMGCDEYANDALSSGFASLCEGDGALYDRFIEYANAVADIITSYGMKPIMFNDGFYYDGVIPRVTLNRDIICSYWTAGWPGYSPAPAGFVEEKGHKILNTHNSWYYVLGRRQESVNPMFNCDDSLKGIETIGHDEVIGGITGEPIGEMMCLWCDEPSACYDDTEKEILKNLILKF